MRVVSYCGHINPPDSWKFWSWGIGKALPEAIGKAKIVYLKDLYTSKVINFSVIKERFDIAYIQQPMVPNKRPAPFVYSLHSDYRPKELKPWIEKVRPNFIGMLQNCPEELVEFGKKYGCRIELFPWFVINKINYVSQKKYSGFISGAVNKAYPFRSKVFNYLKKQQLKNIVLSCGPFDKYPLSYNQYLKILKQTKYYFSGGILDQFVPPKYYEVCNAGACLVSHELPLMKHCGFVSGKTYIKISNVNQIKDVLNSDQWKEIGQAGQKMIKQNHYVNNRAKRILQIYKDFLYKCR